MSLQKQSMDLDEDSDPIVDLYDSSPAGNVDQYVSV